MPVPIPIPEAILESIPETDFGPIIWNRFQNTTELAGNDSDEIFIFTIISTKEPRAEKGTETYGQEQVAPG